MSGEGQDEGEKTHEPTQQRIDDARKKGDLPKSTDLTAAAGWGGLLVALWVVGPGAVRSTGTVLESYLARADVLAPRHFASDGGLSAQIVLEALAGFAPILALPVVFVLVALFAQRAIVFAPEKLNPKLSRISPIAQAKNKFGPTGLFEFAKSSVKLLVISIVLAVYLTGETDHIASLAAAEGRLIPAEMARLALGLLMRIVIVAFIIAAVDVLWQQFDHKRKLRMSHQEMKEEHKRNEGDPMVRSQRRRRAEEIALNQMMAEVPGAAVVIVNPTHYAVALKWDRLSGGAPVVVAKGVDGVALRIREAAAAAGVPIHHDPPTARALDAAVEIGQEIEPAHYHAVAAAIRFAEAMRRKMRERGA